LGRGLEGAYALSKNAKLRSLSEQLGRTLWNNVHPDGVTPYRVGGGNGGMGCHTLAESGTSLLEYRYLEQLCHQDAGPKPNCVEFAERPAEFFANMALRPSLDGLWPNCFERSSGKITFGADGDSFYEYRLRNISMPGS
jgi:hypothetical protein